jgi:hypothetical protein
MRILILGILDERTSLLAVYRLAHPVFSTPARCNHMSFLSRHDICDLFGKFKLIPYEHGSRPGLSSGSHLTSLENGLPRLGYALSTLVRSHTAYHPYPLFTLRIGRGWTWGPWSLTHRQVGVWDATRCTTLDIQVTTRNIFRTLRSGLSILPAIIVPNTANK